MIVHPPRHLVWSTDKVDLQDPFQKRWLLRQTLMHGRAEDIRGLDLSEIKQALKDLALPPEIESLWRRYLEYVNARDKANLKRNNQ
ncbi:hypothetical protein GW797_07430 [Candidatus Parcubacteria bacterium]|nr:hypothetical protein [Candidatus Parcubacteria bacterium]